MLLCQSEGTLGSHFFFLGNWTEEPLERRRHCQTGHGQKLMRNREVGQPEVESVCVWGWGEEEQEVDVLNYVDCEGRAALFSICED